METVSQAREIRLRSRPDGWPTPANFELAEAELPTPASGEVVVRNQYLSVDPYMRGRMNDVRSYVPPFQVGHALEGGAVGVVVATQSDQLAVGDSVLHDLGWREYAVGEAQRFRKIDTTVAPAPAYLGVLGMPGLTAYVGLLDIAGLKAGDTVFVSAGAGAVGSVAGQIARERGAARVVASAGSPEKVRYLLDELGFDAAFNYKDAPVADQLATAAPDGIDVFFDNVGGEQLEAAIASMRPYGRIALCGAISQYNDTEPAPGPRNLFQAIGKRLTLRGFIVLDHVNRGADFVNEVGRWVAEGRIKYRETVVDGIESMPEAFIGLLGGENLGKMIVHIPEAA